MQIVNVEQRSPEWFKLREKRMTASEAQAIGNNGKGLQTYIMKLMTEYYSKAEKEHFSNKDTERGNELEDSAGFLYSMKTGLETQKVGFVIHDEYSGCSPDLLVGFDGLAEIKCPADKAYFDLLISDKVDSGYIWQMQMQMLTTGRVWCDFVAYNPNYEQDMIIKRFYPDPVMYEKLKLGMNSGIEQIKQIEKRMQS